MQFNSVPREVADLNPGPQALPGVLACTKSLKKLSNLYGVALLAQQVIAIISGISVILAYYFIMWFVMGKNAYDISPYFLENTNSALSNLLTCFIYFSYMFIPFIILVYALREHPFRIVPVRPFPEKLKLLPLIAVVLSVSFVSDFVIQYMQYFLSFLNLESTSPDFSVPNNPAAFAAYFFEICILAPLCEEFLFRGVILQNLRRYGNAFAVLVSSVLFSLVHGNLLQIPLAFLTGLVLGILLIETQCIWVTVLMHFCVNLVSTVVSAVSAYWGDAAANSLYAALMLVCFAVSSVILIRFFRSKENRGKIRNYLRSPLPPQFLLKRFFLSPGMIFFWILSTVYVVIYTKIL